MAEPKKGAGPRRKGSNSTPIPVRRNDKGGILIKEEELKVRAAGCPSAGCVCAFTFRDLVLLDGEGLCRSKMASGSVSSSGIRIQVAWDFFDTKQFRTERAFF